jgi:hypothetical protein
VTVHLTAADAGREINLRVGDALELTLTNSYRFQG